MENRLEKKTGNEMHTGVLQGPIVIIMVPQIDSKITLVSICALTVLPCRSLLILVT